MPPSNTSIEQPKRSFTIAAGAVVVHEKRVLLVRNIYGATKGRYLLPAGRAKMGESPDHTAVRETFEETHLHIQVEGLLGVRLWVMDDGEHNYFFMFRARLLSDVSELCPNTAEVDDARFFSKEEMEALSSDETWLGALAVAYKGLDAEAVVWRNYAEFSGDSGVDTPDRWRMWM